MDRFAFWACRSNYPTLLELWRVRHRYLENTIDRFLKCWDMPKKRLQNWRRTELWFRRRTLTQIELNGADCPPESGGQRDRVADPAGGGTSAACRQTLL